MRCWGVVEERAKILRDQLRLHYDIGTTGDQYAYQAPEQRTTV